jgi:hypothetical protein
MTIKLSDEHSEITKKLESVLADLDRLRLQSIAAHVDLALRRFEEHLADHQLSDSSSPSALRLDKKL